MSEREHSAWRIQVTEPALAMISSAIKLGFNSPIHLEIRDAEGSGFTQTLRFDDTGKVIHAEKPELFDNTNGDKHWHAPFTYTLTEEGGTRALELSVDPKPLN